MLVACGWLPFADARVVAGCFGYHHGIHWCCLLWLRDVLLSFQTKPRQAHVRVVIYGAGAAGVNLWPHCAWLIYNVELSDDDPALWRRSINGVSIESPQVLQQRIDRIDQVLLAIRQ